MIYLYFQVPKRKGRLEYNFKSSTSVLTTAVHILPDIMRNLQLEDTLSPRHWLSFTTKDKEKAIGNCEKYETELDTIFGKNMYLILFL